MEILSGFLVIGFLVYYGIRLLPLLAEVFVYLIPRLWHLLFIVLKHVSQGAFWICMQIGRVAKTIFIFLADKFLRGDMQQQEEDIGWQNMPSIHSTDNMTPKSVLDLGKKTLNDPEIPKEIISKQVCGMDQLNELTGLVEVKEQIKDMVSLLKLNKLREETGLPLVEVSKHLVFSGNPGTGKTMIARLVGQIYREMGLLKKGHFKEINGRGLIGQYVGHTAPLVEKIVNEALDGILFIDEAYALVPEDGIWDFGPEAVATLIKLMEDHRDRFVVIVAGYKEDMDRLMNTNPGLKSRFKTKIDFPDYTSDELVDIFYSFCKGASLNLNHPAVSKIEALFNELINKREKHFGNGRAVRNVFERCLTRQSRRLGKWKSPQKHDLQQLCGADIPKASEVSWE